MSYAAETTTQSFASPIRVFLIDEEAVVRAGMCILIDSWSISNVVGQANVITEAIAAVETIKPDLIILSHSGRSMESLESLDDLVRVAGQVPLVLLTSSRDPKVGTAALKAGAKAIMLKQNAAGELR